MKYLYPIILALFGLSIYSCGSESAQTLDLSKTYQVRLEGENITMEVPNRYQRTTVETMAFDISNYFAAQQDTQAVIKQLTVQQFMDEKIDIYYDTISKFSFFTVRNTPFVPLSHQTAQSLASQLNKQILSMHLGFGIKIEKLTNSYNEGGGTAVLRMKYKISNQFAPAASCYYSIYACSMDSGFGTLVTEISLGNVDIYPVIWSFRS